MRTRDEILVQATEECLQEMYKWAQPSIDLLELRSQPDFKDDPESPLYKKHFLSPHNFLYIRDVYAKAYGITDEWDDTFNCLIKQLTLGGIEDDYKPATKDSPGYRDYKKVSPLKDVLKSPEDFETIVEYIKKVQTFFRWHSRELDSFNITIALGCSPNSNAKDVEKYWRENGRPDFQIKDFKIDDVIYGGVNDEYVDIDEDEFIKTLK